MEKEEIRKRLVPIIDHSKCTACCSCIEICPEVFQRNTETGSIEVMDMHEYPEECIQEAMTVCPGGCITLEESS
jgi:ferredoxin